MDKFVKSDAASNARVQVCLPNGEYYDINGMQLLENKLSDYCKELDIVNALLYSNWLKAISKHKYLNTKNTNDLFTKEDFSKEEFQLIYDDVW